jgi:hypothetical protein
MIGSAFIAARAGAKRFDAELVHHVLVVFGGGPVLGQREIASLAENDHGESEEQRCGSHVQDLNKGYSKKIPGALLSK